MTRLGRWIVETRAGRIAFRTIAAALTFLLVYVGIILEVEHQTRKIVHRVNVIEQKVRPIDVLHACLRTAVCRRLLVTADSLPVAVPRGGDAHQPGSPSGHQPAGPPSSGPPAGHPGHGKGSPPAPTGNPPTTTPGSPPPTSHAAPSAVEQVESTAHGVIETVTQLPCEQPVGVRVVCP